MKRELQITKDGSHTVSIPELNVTYHSVHGSVQESQHVFIRAGLQHAGILDRPGTQHILEIGFGTGLNALLTMIEAEKKNGIIHYTTLEPFPLEDEIVQHLNYCEDPSMKEIQPLFEKIHHCEWEKAISITPHFILEKKLITLAEFSSSHLFDLVYFDAFAPGAQPELWTKDIFEQLNAMMQKNGILVTYCSKGDVRRALQSAGFTIEKIPGPPGKREMLRAVNENK